MLSKMTTRLAFSSFVLLLTIIEHGESLKCYVCNTSEGDSYCNPDDFGELQSCDLNVFQAFANSKSLSKTTLSKGLSLNAKCAKISLKTEGQIYHTRTCIPELPEICEAIATKSRESGHSVHVTCNYCDDKDGCNGASLLPVIAPLLASSIAVLVKLFV